MVENDLKLLEENLVKKKALLECLIGLFDTQNDFLNAPDMELEKFDECMDKQDELLQDVLVLEEETELLYKNLCTQALLPDGPYAEQIRNIQMLISDITEEVNSLQKKERINKQKLEVYFETQRRLIGSDRRSSKAALDYYKSMNRTNVIPPQFMDHKK